MFLITTGTEKKATGHRGRDAKYTKNLWKYKLGQISVILDFAAHHQSKPAFFPPNRTVFTKVAGIVLKYWINMCVFVPQNNFSSLLLNIVK